jgi:hypothetical protein
MTIYAENIHSLFILNNNIITIIDKNTQLESKLNIKFNIIINSIKADGLILYLLDIENYIYQYQYKNNIYEYFKFTRIPIINKFYNEKVQIQILNDNLWCPQHTSILYQSDEEDCETVFVVKQNPTRICIYDPWLSPNVEYTISIPDNENIYKIDASGKILCIMCKNIITEEFNIYYRDINYDIAGYNPFITYQLINNKNINPYVFRNIFRKIMDINIVPMDINNNLWNKINVKSSHLFTIKDTDIYIYDYNDEKIDLYNTVNKEWAMNIDININDNYKLRNIIENFGSIIDIDNLLFKSDDFMLDDNDIIVIKINAEPIYLKIIINDKIYYVLKMIVCLIDVLKSSFTYILVDSSGKFIYKNKNLLKIKKNIVNLK